MSTSKRDVTKADTKKAREYLEDRGFTPAADVMKEYGLTVTWDDWDEWLRLRIPFLNGDPGQDAAGAYGTGRFIGTEEELESHDKKMRDKRALKRAERQSESLLGRTVKVPVSDSVGEVPKYRNDAGSKPHVFGTPKAWQAPHVAITESIFDALAMDHAGLPAFAMGGASNVPTEELLNLLRDREEITVVGQQDQKSRRWATNVTAALSGVLGRVYTFSMDDYVKDVAELMEAIGAKAIFEFVMSERKRVENPNRRIFSIADLDMLTDVESGPVWGTDDEPLWADGQSIILLAHTGIGKTTLMLNLGLSSLREYLDDDNPFNTPDPLGYPMAETERVLYIAADRYRQVKDRLRTMTSPEERARLERRFILHKGPPEIDVAKKPDKFAEWVFSLRPGLVIIDSLKDVASDLASDASGSAFNRAVQLLVTDRVNLGVISHPRKGTSEQRANRELMIDDVYGSGQITFGAGSVLVVEGQKDEPHRRIRTLKEIKGDPFQFQFNMDKATGLMVPDKRLHVPHPEVLMAFLELADDDDDGSSTGDVMKELDIENTGRALKNLREQVFALQDEGWLTKVRDYKDVPKKGRVPALWRPSKKAIRKRKAITKRAEEGAEED